MNQSCSDFYSLNEYDGNIIFQNESIQSLKKFNQGQTIYINFNNAVSLHFLSKKYNIAKLLNETNHFISTHYLKIIDNFLCQYNEKYKFNIGEYEDLISDHLKFDKLT